MDSAGEMDFARVGEISPRQMGQAIPRRVVQARDRYNLDPEFSPRVDLIDILPARPG